MHSLYFDSLDQENEHRKLWSLRKPERPTPEHSKRYEREKLIKEDEKLKTNQTAQDYIMRDLFIWSILMNHPEMALVFLSHMKYRICPALIATKIFKRYYEKATYGVLKDGYQESAAYFEQYAVDCINKCADHNVELACKIILQQNEIYGYVSCLQV
jgi:hypothetical protein